MSQFLLSACATEGEQDSDAFFQHPGSSHSLIMPYKTSQRTGPEENASLNPIVNVFKGIPLKNTVQMALPLLHHLQWNFCTLTMKLAIFVLRQDTKASSQPSDAMKLSLNLARP